MRFFLILALQGTFLLKGIAQDNFYKISSQTIYPLKLLQYDSSHSYTGTDTDSLSLWVQTFEISRQVTFREYKKFLTKIKADSTESYYKKHLPKFYDARTGILEHYIQSSEYDDKPVIGISYEAAESYCKWKTDLLSKNDTSYYYSLPKISEWLAALHYLDSAGLVHDFNNEYSNWTTGIYFEAVVGPGGWTFDQIFQVKENDPPRMKRKRIIGHSFLRQYSSLYQSIFNFEYSFNGSRDISFRIIKAKNRNAQIHLSKQ